jgi:integrase
LLITYALVYFAPEERLHDLDEQGLRGFVDWLRRLIDDDGRRHCDRSVHNAVLPLQSCLRHAARAGLLGDGSGPVILLPRRRRGRAYEFDERRFLTREQLARLLAQIPDGWRPFFDLLASTGCGSPRRSQFASWTPTWMRNGRGSTCVVRSWTVS